MSEKGYTYVSLTNENNTPKLRFTNFLMTRTKRLKGMKPSFKKLPREMTKLEAANYLKKNPGDGMDPKLLEMAIQRVVSRHDNTKAEKPPKAPKAEKKATVKKASTKPAAEKKEKAPRTEKPKPKPKPKKEQAPKASKDEIVVEVDTGAGGSNEAAA